MNRPRRLRIVLTTTAMALALAQVAPTPPLSTIHASSANAELPDVESSAETTHALTHADLIEQVAAGMGVDDLSFLDLTKSAVFVLPEEDASLGADGWVLVLPVRNGARALEVLAQWYPRSALEGNVTVLRRDRAEDADSGSMDQDAPVEDETAESLYVQLQDDVLVFGRGWDQVSHFDRNQVLSKENLAPGSSTLSIEMDPVAALMNVALSAANRTLLEMPSRPVGAGGCPPIRMQEPTARDTSRDNEPAAERGPSEKIPPEPRPAETTQGVAPSKQNTPARQVPDEPPAAVIGQTVGGGPFLVVGDVQPPKIIFRAPLDYPEAARRAKVQGRVILEATIESNGEIGNVRVLRSVPLLDDAAIASLRGYKYKPAMKEGRPVSVLISMIMDFSLRPDPDVQGTPSEVTSPLSP